MGITIRAGGCCTGKSRVPGAVVTSRLGVAMRGIRLENFRARGAVVESKRLISDWDWQVRGIRKYDLVSSTGVTPRAIAIAEQFGYCCSC